MILEFSIENTLSIREQQTLSFEAVYNEGRTDFDSRHIFRTGNTNILKLACIYGANASGKTNMLSALEYYLGFMTKSFFELRPDEPTGYVPFRFENNVEEENGHFNLVFFAPYLEKDGTLIKYIYDLRLNQHEVIEESLSCLPKGQRSRVFLRKKNEGIKWGNIVRGAKKNAEEMLRGNSSMVSVGAQANIPLLKLVYDYVTRRLHYNSTEDVLEHIENDELFKRKVLGLLKSTDFGSITDIQIENVSIDESLLPENIRRELEKKGEKPQIKRTNFIHTYGEKDYQLRLGLESNGTRRLLSVADTLSSVPDSVLVLEDEIEASLHPDLVEAFLRLFLLISTDSQLVFTTHNTDLLESGLLRDDEIWFTYKTDCGNSTYSSISDFTGVRSGVSRRKLYKAGKFGALPLIDMDYLKDLFNTEEDQE